MVKVMAIGIRRIIASRIKMAAFMIRRDRLEGIKILSSMVLKD